MGQVFLLDSEINEYSVYVAREWLRRHDGPGQHLTININSPGGSVVAAYSLFSELLAAKATITTRNVGICASAASFLLLAGHEIEMHDYALIMWHNPWNLSVGDSNQMRKDAEVLDKFRAGIATIYQKRTGRELQSVLDDMDKETWFDASEAKELGLATKIIETPGIAATNKQEFTAMQSVQVYAAMRDNATKAGYTPAAPASTGPGAAAPGVATPEASTPRQPSNDPLKITNDDNMSVQAIAAKLGCKENEVDGRVAALLEESTSQRTELKAAKQDLTNTKAALKDAEDKLSAYQQKEQAKVKADAEAAVDAAVSERRIPADDRADWLEAYLQAPERTAKQLAGITPAPKLSGVPETGSDKNDPEKDELSPFNKRLAQLEAKNEK